MTTPTDQAAKRRIFKLPLGDRQVDVYEPTEGQVLVITRIPRIIDRGEMLTGLMTFGDVLDAIVVKPDDRAYAYQGIVNDTIPLEQYLELCTGILEKMKQDAEANSGREERRARKRAAPAARRK